MNVFAARLAVLQLPLVYLALLVLGLTLYGSEFGAPSGRVYLVASPAIVIVGLWPTRHAAWLARVARPAALVGIALAAFAYRPLHFAWWDERSLDQALRLAALGLVTAIVATGARAQLEHAQVPARRGLAPALLVIALAWLTAAWQPMLPFLALAAGFCVFSAARDLGRAPRGVEDPVKTPPRAGWSRYIALLAGLDLTLVAWDWQTVPEWGAPIATGFAAAAASAWILPRLPASAGALLGAVLASGAARDRSLPYWALLGFLPAHLATQNLAFASARLVLLVPLLFLLRRAPAARALPST